MPRDHLVCESEDSSIQTAELETAVCWPNFSVACAPPGEDSRERNRRKEKMENSSVSQDPSQNWWPSQGWSRVGQWVKIRHSFQRPIILSMKTLYVPGSLLLGNRSSHVPFVFNWHTPDLTIVSCRSGPRPKSPLRLSSMNLRRLDFFYYYCHLPTSHRHHHHHRHRHPPQGSQPLPVPE